jgi:hypothetical protein
MSEETIKYSSYTPAQKKASQVYRLKNKDKINEQRKKYYQARKEADPAFLEYKRTKAKEYYDKKKLLKAGSVTDVSETVEIPIEPVVVVPEVVEPVVVVPEVVEPVEEVKLKKTKRQRKPKEPSDKPQSDSDMEKMKQMYIKSYEANNGPERLIQLYKDMLEDKLKNKISK